MSEIDDIACCMDCRYSDDSDWGGHGQPMQCRRFPPSLVQRISANGIDFVHAHPEVLAMDWCGEFSRKTE